MDSVGKVSYHADQVSRVGGLTSIGSSQTALHAGSVLKLASDSVGTLEFLEEAVIALAAVSSFTTGNLQRPNVGRRLSEDTTPLVEVQVLVSNVGVVVRLIEVIKLHSRVRDHQISLSPVSFLQIPTLSVNSHWCGPQGCSPQEV